MHHPIPAEHAQHDLELIAGHAAGDLSANDQTRADAQLTSCTSCADLRRDLVAIAAATRTLPAPANPHDFRLTQSDAASLRRGGWIKSLLRPFASPDSTVRPLARAFTSLGVAGLLIANILPVLLGGFGSAGAAPALAPAAGVGGGLLASTAAPAPAASAGSAASGAPGLYPVQVLPQASRAIGDSSNEYGSFGQPTSAAGGESKADEGTNEPIAVLGEPRNAGTEQPYTADRLREVERTLASEESNPVALGSSILLAVGLALFGLRFVARRVR